MKTTFYLILCLFLPSIGVSQIQFSSDSWSNILERSRSEKKAIFVDVHTKWCAPCRKMARTTFMDVELGEYMNTHFINVKWDAEGAKYGALSKKHKIGTFPTIMFLSHDGTVHKKIVGFQTQERLLKVSKDISQFLNTNFHNVTNELLKLSDADKIEAFLFDNLGMNFASKKTLFEKYLELNSDDKVLNETQYDVLIDNMFKPAHVETAISQLHKTADFKNEGLDAANKKRKKMFYQSRIKAVLMQSAKQCIANKEQDNLEAFLQQNLQFGKNTNKITKGSLAQIENDNFRKEYYRKYRLYDDYVMLINKVIERDVLPNPPEKLKHTDKKAQSIIAKREKTHGPVSGSNLRLIYQNHSKAYKNAFTLTGFSDDYIQFFSADESKLKKALEFTDLAITYMDIPETRLSRAKIFKLLKQNDNAFDETKLGLESNLMDWRIKSKLQSVQKSLSK